MRTINLSQIYICMLRVIMCSLRQQARRATASIKKPIHNVKECGQIPRNRLVKAGTVSLHLWRILLEQSCNARTMQPRQRQGMVEPIGIEPMT